jgi:hypothetical protein
LAQREDAWTVVDPAGEPIFLVAINHLRDNIPADADTDEYPDVVQRLRTQLDQITNSPSSSQP